ncbi:hypothetical protein AMJ49_02325 [Parcubacteria bacterium DG_74_2]|nr:MAG: hypothetical protein AMJ49_02325 [Parcubacteria bacterium DG_74_2]
MNYEKGESLIELLIAVGIFLISISISIFFLLDSYISGRLASEITIANFLAEEGMEAVKSIRDNNWLDLLTGNHGLTISENHWIFQGPEEDLSDQLQKGKRVIGIEDIDSDRKKITSRVIWQFTEERTEEVRLVSYLTNWQKISPIEIRKPTAHTDPAQKTISPENAYDYPDGNTFSTTRYDISRDPSIILHNWETSTKTYTSLVLKYRYQADEATDDRYAISYSTTGCNGEFTDLISLTSTAAPDTILSTELSSTQDLIQLCLKIYTEKIRAADKKNLYTKDVWTEGTY